MIARAYSSGYLDCILINGDVAPMWTVTGGQDAVIVSDMDAVVLECLHLRGTMEENDTSDPTILQQQPLWPALLTDPLEMWTLYVVLPHGLVSIKLIWASYLEDVISKMENEIESGVVPRSHSVEERDCDDEHMSKERLNLRDALSNRPKR